MAHDPPGIPERDHCWRRSMDNPAAAPTAAYSWSPPGTSKLQVQQTFEGEGDERSDSGFRLVGGDLKQISFSTNPEGARREDWPSSIVG
jgi:hypothetical protein